MQEIESVIGQYHLAYMICFGIALASFMIAVFLFFKFNIPRIFSIRTGREIKKTIRQMEEVTEHLSGIKNIVTARIGSSGERKKRKVNAGFFIEKQILIVHSNELI